MDDVLSLQLRPRSFAEMIGQEQICSQISNQIRSGRIPKAWFITGPSGSGKTTLAKILGIALNQPSFENFGYLTPEQYDAGKQFEMVERNGASLTGVEDVRDLLKRTGYLPMVGQFRIIIIDEIHRLSKNAQDALLLPTENATHNVWILCTNEPQDVLPTLQRRCEVVKLKPLYQADMRALIAMVNSRLNTQLGSEIADQIYDAGVTTGGFALRTVEAILAGKPTQEALLAVDQVVDTKALCRALLAGQWQPFADAFSSMDNESIKNLRYALLGYLKACVLKGREYTTQKRAADLIVYLTTDVPYDAGSLGPWLIGRIFNCCQPPQNNTQFVTGLQTYPANA